MFKRYLAIFAVFILTFSLLVGCGASKEKGTIRKPATPLRSQTETGTYGQIDSNSIEIEVNDSTEKHKFKPSNFLRK